MERKRRGAHSRFYFLFILGQASTTTTMDIYGTANIDDVQGEYEKNLCDFWIDYRIESPRRNFLNSIDRDARFEETLNIDGLKDHSRNRHLKYISNSLAYKMILKRIGFKHNLNSITAGFVGGH